MLRLLFIRHGETDWNLGGRIQGLTDTPLNDKGLDQAERLASRVGDEHSVAALYSSPLQRARVTAELIARRLGKSPILDDRLVERHMGPLEGLTMEDIRALFPEVVQAWKEGLARPSFPNEEPRESFRDRIQEFLTELQVRHEGQMVAVVTHGGTMAMFLAILMGFDIGRRLPFSFDNASLTIVELEGPVNRMILMNDTCHLRDRHSPAGEKQEFILDEKLAGDRVPAEVI